jgi:hypothetical protein
LNGEYYNESFTRDEQGNCKKGLAMASLLVRSAGNGFRLGCSSGEMPYYREHQSGIIGEWQVVRIVFKQG